MKYFYGVIQSSAKTKSRFEGSVQPIEALERDWTDWLLYYGSLNS